MDSENLQTRLEDGDAKKIGTEGTNNIEQDAIDKIKPFVDEIVLMQIQEGLKESKKEYRIGYITEKNEVSPFIGKEPWPEDVHLYQPYETEQILLPDMANCLAVQAFLKMCDLNFSIEYKANAEDMSPTGKVPFIKCGAYLVSELEPINNFVASKGYSLTEHLDHLQKSDMRAYMSLVNTVLGNAENYITWVDNETYRNVTKPRYGSVFPFPLNHYLPYLKRKEAIKRLSALGWYKKSLDKVYDEVDRACSALSLRLGKEPFFFGDKPTELDAMLFAHIYTIIATPLPSPRLAATVRGYDSLIEHCQRIERLFS